MKNGSSHLECPAGSSLPCVTEASHLTLKPFGSARVLLQLIATASAEITYLRLNRQHRIRLFVRRQLALTKSVDE